MWNNAVGVKFSSKSRPFSQRGKVLIVACENSIVAQELLLQKLQILKKLEPSLKALKMTITDIHFDTKRWVVDEEV